MLEMFHPPHPEKETRPTKQGPYEKLQEKLLDFLEPYLMRMGFDTRNKTLDFKTYNEAKTSSEQLSLDTAKFLRDLFPTKNPPFEQGISAPNNYKQNRWKEVRGLGSHKLDRLPRSEYLKERERVLSESLYRKEQQPRKGTVKETKLGNETRQYLTNILRQGDSKNLIYEHISNRIRRDQERNDVDTSLLVQDSRTGATLDLNMLLPPNYEFMPKALNAELYQTNKGSNTVAPYKQEEPPTLEGYDMRAAGAESFSVQHLPKPLGYFHNIVTYGDLTQPGALLSLLHEVAHTWQSVHKDRTSHGKHYFERELERVSSVIFETTNSTDPQATALSDQQIARLYELGATCLDRNGTKLPIRGTEVFNIPNEAMRLLIVTGLLLETANPDRDHESLERAKLPELANRARIFPIKSEKLEKLLEAYTAQERNAWAHALRVLRLLRERGLDIEPELETISEIKDQIDPCLQSYQNSLDFEFLFSNLGARFLREKSNTY